MNAQDLHDACHEACMECPQFMSYDDDTMISGWPHQFGDVPKYGLRNVIKFWRNHGDTLWNGGYDEALPSAVIQLFEAIDAIEQAAIDQYCAQL